MKITSKHLMPVIFILFIAAYGVFLYITNLPVGPALGLKEAEAEGCLLDYGKSECIGGKLGIPFYNAGSKTVTYTEITVPTTRGADIAKLNEHLGPKATGAAELTGCGEVDASRNLKLRWCCDKCYEAEMTEPVESVELVEPGAESRPQEN